MAKNIKAIKCPQCGSVNKNEIKEHYYVCKNCGTTYFLDDDDINVNIRHEYQHKRFDWEKLKNPKLVPFLIIAGVIFILFFTQIIGSLFKSKNSDSYTNPKSVVVDKKPEFSYRISDYVVSKSTNPEVPLFMFFCSKSPENHFGGDNKHYFVRFYDPVSRKILNDYPLNKWGESFYINSRVYQDGNTYIIADKSNRIFKVDEVHYTLIDVTKEFFGGMEEFASGIAVLSFLQSYEGEGFQIMTNDGKELYYFPFAKKIYKSTNELRDAGIQMETLKDGWKNRVIYDFSEKSSEYPDEKIQLVKIWFKYNPGYPSFFFSKITWRKVYSYPKRSGVFTNNYPYKKMLVDAPRVTKYEDLTPGRLYFNASVMTQDSSSVYILGYPNANPEGNSFLQKLDGENGKILWTYSPKSKPYEFWNNRYNYFIYPNGIAFMYYDKSNGNGTSSVYVFIDKTGKATEFDENLILKN